MTLQFPNTPTDGQVYTDTNSGNRWVWDSANTVWKSTSTFTQTITVSSTQPGSPVVGQLWWNQDYGRLFIYYNDGTSNQWVDATLSPDISGIYGVANAANLVASAAFITANSSYASVNSNWTVTNTTYSVANSAYAVANAAYANANTKLANTTGTLTGALTTTGSITANGYLYVTPTDAGNEGGEIQLSGAGNYAGWALDAYQNNHRTFVRTGSTLANVTYFHALGGSLRMGVNKADPLYTLDVNGDLNTSSRGITKASMPSGSILQIQQTVLTGTFGTTSTSFTDITGVSVSITPTSSTSKIFIMVSMYRGCTAAVQTRFRLIRSGTPIYLSDAAGSRSQSSAGCYVGNADVGYHLASIDIKYIDSPATTSAITYNVQLACQGGETIYIGRTGTDGDGVTTMRAPASITVMEIAQ